MTGRGGGLDQRAKSQFDITALCHPDLIAVRVRCQEAKAFEAQLTEVVFVLGQPGLFAGMLEFIQLQVGQCRCVGA